MKLKTKWSDKLAFRAEAEGQSVSMDARPPLGAGNGLTPKQLLLAAACGCTGMDVVALLRKYKQPLESLEIEAEVSVAEGRHPAVFLSMELTFELTGPLDAEKALEAIHLSQTKFCSVNAMLSKAFPITYQAFLNGALIGSGEARFPQGE